MVAVGNNPNFWPNMVKAYGIRILALPILLIGAGLAAILSNNGNAALAGVSLFVAIILIVLLFVFSRKVGAQHKRPL